MSNSGLGTARWWEVRLAANRKPTTYRCPLCGQRLPSLAEHMLLLPEGQPAGRRHAHRECVLAARRAGRLPTRQEWRQTLPGGQRVSRWRRLRSRLVRRTSGSS